MKAQELRDLSLSELEARIKDEQESITKLDFNRAVAGELEKPTEIRKRRRELARLKTIYTEKLRSGEGEQQQQASNETQNS